MIRLYLLVVAVAMAVLYGSTYHSFRSFNLAEPGGAADAIHYVEMARGHPPDDVEIRHYRWLTPRLARLMQPLTLSVTPTDDLSLRAAFYVVNSVFSVMACVALFGLLQRLRYAVPLALLGVCAFAASRVTVLVTATPLVDAGYFCAIAIIAWLTLERRARALAVALPLLVLTKETIIPFLVLPFLTDLRKSAALWTGVVAAVATFVIAGEMIEGYYSGEDASFAGTVLEHAAEVAPTARRLFTWSGLHDAQNGFSLWLPLSLVGAVLNRRYRYRDLPPFLLATIPIAVGLALLSGNFGRMLFAAFPAVIALALIPIEHAARLAEGTVPGRQP